MNQNVIDRFNAGSAENDMAFEKAKAAGFPWRYFFERAEGKARMSGLLPERGAVIIRARYLNAADLVAEGLMQSFESVGDGHTPVGWCRPWLDVDMQRWKEFLCSFTAMMFDAGVVASFTRSRDGEADPVEVNGAYSLFGDVGFTGLRGKAMGILREAGGDAAVNLVGEIGDCACVHLYADRLNLERVFMMSPEVREQYMRSSMVAAYVAGAAFGEAVQSIRGQGKEEV